MYSTILLIFLQIYWLIDEPMHGSPHQKVVMVPPTSIISENEVSISIDK